MAKDRRASVRAREGLSLASVVIAIKNPPQSWSLPVQQTSIVQRDESFVPRVVAITTGSRVEFPNLDS